MVRKKVPGLILFYQNIGFMLIIAISWLNEIIGLPGIIMGAQHTHIWSEALLETIIILCVWIPVNFMTRKILERLFYLETMVKMCGWCRKIEFEGKWYTQEEFYMRGFNTMVTHGICQECLDNQEEKRKALKEKIS